MLELPDERISSLLKRVVEVPSLSQAVRMVVECCGEEPSARRLAECVGIDFGLTAKVLRLANSAFFSLAQPVASLTQAASLLGVKTVRSLAMSCSFTDLLAESAGGLEARVLWRHSLAVALAARRIAAAVLPDLENEIHVAGLLHDVGIALLIHHLPEDYARVLEAARRREERLAGAEKEEFGVSHAEVGHSLAARSRLPPLICDCIRCHETPAEGSFQPAPQLAEALEVLALAHAWAVGRGFALWQGDSFSSPVEAPSSWRLGAEDLARLLEDAAADVAARETDFFPPGRDVLIDRRAPSGAPAASH